MSTVIAVRNRARRDERGEGVISAAIAVLIMSFLGVIMWAGFKTTLGNAQSNVDTQISQIGR
jgi:TRAP-type C4-dicarboxylate transport system permease small subunit